MAGLSLVSWSAGQLVSWLAEYRTLAMRVVVGLDGSIGSI